MKKTKILSLISGLVLGAAVMLGVSVQARADYVDKGTDKYGVDLSYYDSMYPGSASEYYYGGGDCATVYLRDQAASISDLKTSSKKFKAKLSLVRTGTSSYTSSYSGVTTTTKNAPYYKIAYYCKKKGTYTVSFKVRDKDNKVLETKSFKVKVGYTAYSYPFKSVQYAGDYLYKYHRYVEGEDYEDPAMLYTTKKSGKLKVKMSKGYKIKKIEVTTFKKNGKTVTKKTGNNKTIKVTTIMKGTEKYNSGSGSYAYGYETYRNPMFPRTEVKIYYTKKGSKEVMTDYFPIYYLNEK